MPEREWFGTPIALMGFWGSSSDSQGDELDFGNRSNYLEIREYVESRIGSMNVHDRNLQGVLSKLLNKDRNSWYQSRQGYNDAFPNNPIGPFWSDIEIKHMDNDTYLRCRTPHLISSVRSAIKCVGFAWDKRQKTWVLRNHKISVEEIRIMSERAMILGCTEGIKSYCEAIAYRQELEGIPNTFSASWVDGPTVGINSLSSSNMTKQATSDGDVSKSVETVEDNPNITLTGMDSKSSGGPYSKVEQLERLIDLRKKGEITTEEFNDMKKELLS